MRAIHLFNPGYEAAVLSGQVRYTPPVNVQIMRRDLVLYGCGMRIRETCMGEDEEQLMFVGNVAYCYTTLGPGGDD